MSVAMSVPIGVIVARERSSDPWHEYRWRPVSIFMDPPEDVSWREVERGRGVIHYHAATMPLMLNNREKIAYRVNLANGVPSVYVVLREATGVAGAMPVSVAHVTASPFEIQAYGDSGTDSVNRVPMPDPLVQLLRAFVDGEASPQLPGRAPPGSTSSPPVGSARSSLWGGSFTRLKFSG